MAISLSSLGHSKNACNTVFKRCDTSAVSCHIVFYYVSAVMNGGDYVVKEILLKLTACVFVVVLKDDSHIKRFVVAEEPLLPAFFATET